MGTIGATRQPIKNTAEREALGFMFVFRKNKNSEKTGARVRNTPFGTYCYALTDKEHSRTRSVRIYVLFILLWRYRRFHSNLPTDFPNGHVVWPIPRIMKVVST
uniref:Uncharacterized protein n=1 Tax=Candidatus Kentrum sp. SD TaxID=2126332 RepID=A0A451BQV1_9GAMM|nr:MAG: hypothetical protein BECKSD772D_GA0070982_11382 [Candidatus Kentron sp. SD]